MTILFLLAADVMDIDEDGSESRQELFEEFERRKRVCQSSKEM